jgi:hypothetical protein
LLRTSLATKKIETIGKLLNLARTVENENFEAVAAVQVAEIQADPQAELSALHSQPSSSRNFNQRPQRQNNFNPNLNNNSGHFSQNTQFSGQPAVSAPPNNPAVGQSNPNGPEQAPRNPNIVCFRCRQQGHPYQLCQAMMPHKIFCFRCGYPDVTAPRCPRCAGNGQ